MTILAGTYHLLQSKPIASIHLQQHLAQSPFQTEILASRIPNHFHPFFPTMSSLSDTVVSFVRPALILLCGMLLFNLPTTLYKIGMYLRGGMYLLFCNDKKWRKPQDPSIVVDPILAKENSSPDYENVVERKTIYFVRHGESTWNDTFNKGSHRTKAVFVIGFLPGLIKSLLVELYLILSGKMDRCVVENLY